VTAPADIDNGDYFTLNDGANPAVEFEFDPMSVDDGVTTNRVEIAYDDSLTDAVALQAAIITAINGVGSTFRIGAAANGTNITLTSELFGSIGNTTTGDNVMETSFTLSGTMSGGAAHDCPTGTGCAIDADCANGDCLTATNLCN
jgi:hypothetical protein